KVLGQARYIAEQRFPNTAHGYFVTSSIAKGRIRAIDSTEAEKQAGVVVVLSHKNAPKLTIPERPEGRRPYTPFTSDAIFFSGQPVAAVIAETFEQARYAAALVKVTYEEQKPETDPTKMPGKGFAAGPDRPVRGTPDQAFASAAIKVDSEYTIPIEHHNPMETHATLARWEGDKLTVYDKTQGVQGTVQFLASSFAIPPTNIRVMTPFVGGAFGAALAPSPNLLSAAMAAKLVNRPVRIVYSRRQSATAYGYRPASIQKIKLAAEPSGKLTAIIHEAVHNTSSHDTFTESLVGVSRVLYACPNVKTVAQVARLDLQTPRWKRAPGMVSGVFALESAMDELSYKLKIDPVELRLINYAETNPDNGLPFSSKELRACYKMGAEKFGWSKRKPEPRLMREGRWLIGYGMATGTWPAGQAPASVRLTLKVDGSLLIESSVTDIGPGTYTMGSIVASQSLGIPIEKVSFVLGDSALPPGPMQGGSTVTSSVGTAIQEGAQKLIGEIMELANRDANSAFKGLTFADVTADGGAMVVKGKPAIRLPFVDVLRKNNLGHIGLLHSSTPNAGERAKYSISSHGAQFVEVRVDEELGIIRVPRVVQATAAGKIINPKGAHNQEIGGVVWGIGMALTEQTEIDHRIGRIMNPNLAGYHVPVNADVGEIETIFVEEIDKIVNPIGAKGLGELGMVGIPAAIANAVYHATGKRIRDLPITPDKLL
ncbi:MAG TPA: xanthine dehydrogenase family protein molybdopterin-binding subunit, partial [Pyrinomonadaceae bacterium]|nr:xanthine dehydrogenase family protein molybdopterin-binding subunit [Pyrinomonadaceae bacterium]